MRTVIYLDVLLLVNFVVGAAFLLAAVVAVAPNEGRLWQPGEACWIRQRLPY